MQTIELYYTTGISKCQVVKEQILDSRRLREPRASDIESEEEKPEHGSHLSDKAWVITIKPNEYRCPVCGEVVTHIYPEGIRRIRCQDIGRIHAYIEVQMHRLYCPHCRRTSYEHLPFLASPKARVTRSLARTIVELRKAMSISDLARWYDLPWSTVKDIDKTALERRYARVDLKDVKAIGIDELYVFGRERSDRKYITVVRDLETGAVLNVSRGRGAASLKMFESRLKRQKAHIEAVCMDMSGAYAKWARENLPDATIVFDHFHVIKAMNDRLDRVRRAFYAGLMNGKRRELEAAGTDRARQRRVKQTIEAAKAAIKGKRYLLLENKDDLNDEGQASLRKLLDLGGPIAEAHALKEDLRAVYAAAKDAGEARTLFEGWIVKARASRIREIHAMADMVEGHLDGIVAFWSCRRATNAASEGFNNKIRWLIKQAYGYRDYAYFRLKVFDLPNLKLVRSDI